VSSSFLLRVIIGAIEYFSPHEDNTKETRSCTIVLGRQHDYVKPSQCRGPSAIVWHAKDFATAHEVVAGA
jgi:hypothetical protein